jgi:hypothetical protein
MKVKYTLKEEDFITFNKYHLRTSKIGKQKILMLRWIGPAMFMVATVLHAIFLGFDSLFASTMALISVFWYYWYPSRVEKEVSIAVRKMLAEGENRSFLAEQTLELLEIGVVLSNEYETQTMSWSTFIKVEKTEDNIYLFKSPVMAIVIPRSAFESIEQYVEFYEFLLNKINKVKVNHD